MPGHPLLHEQARATSLHFCNGLAHNTACALGASLKSPEDTGVTVGPRFDTGFQVPETLLLQKLLDNLAEVQNAPLESGMVGGTNGF